MKVWAHRMTAEQESEPLAVALELARVDGPQPIVLDPTGCAALPAPDADGAPVLVLRIERDGAAPRPLV
jgi:hypothetical protein